MSPEFPNREVELPSHIERFIKIVRTRLDPKKLSDPQYVYAVVGSSKMEFNGTRLPEMERVTTEEALSVYEEIVDRTHSTLRALSHNSLQEK